MENLKSTDAGSTRMRFEALLAEGNLSGLEEAWVEEVSRSEGAGPAEPEAFLAAADARISRGDRERARMLLELFLPILGDKHRSRRLEVLRRMILASPGRNDLRADYVECFREVHAGSRFQEVCLAVAAVESAPDLRAALNLLERLLMFEPGTHVWHEAGWGVGLVESVDPALRQAVVDLEGKRHHRIALQAIADILKPLPKDHFLALGRGGMDGLKAIAESEPVKLIGILVSSFGNPLELKVIKARLVPDVIAAEGWSRFWSRAKALLRDSGFFRVSDRSPFVVERLKASMSYEDELLRQFEAGDLNERLGIARKYGKDRSGKFPALRDKILADLRKVLAGEPGPRALAAAVVLEKIQGPGEGPGVAGALRAAGDPVAAILGMDSPDDRRRALEALPEALGEAWTKAALSLFSRGDDALRDAAAKMLSGSPVEKEAIGLVAEAVRSPKTYPDLFTWATRALIGGDSSPVLGPIRAILPSEVIRRVFDLLDHLGLCAEREGKAVMADALGRARGLLSSEEGRYFRQVIKPLPRDEARQVYQRAMSCGGLSEPLRVKLLEILMVEFHDISRSEVRPIWEEDFIYVTESGVSRKRLEFRELTEEKLPKNFQDIGRAAAFGDLSENAEYTSALEERDRLTKRATELKRDLDLVRIISPAMLKDHEVFLGSRVRLLNSKSNREVTYKILGPWDGGPEDGVLSYRSPLAIVLIGSKVGDEVEAQLPGGTEKFKVLEIGSAFDPEPGSAPKKAGGQ